MTADVRFITGVLNAVIGFERRLSEHATCFYSVSALLYFGKARRWILPVVNGVFCTAAALKNSDGDSVPAHNTTIYVSTLSGPDIQATGRRQSKDKASQNALAVHSVNL